MDIEIRETIFETMMILSICTFAIFCLIFAKACNEEDTRSKAQKQRYHAQLLNECSNSCHNGIAYFDADYEKCICR